MIWGILIACLPVVAMGALLFSVDQVELFWIVMRYLALFIPLMVFVLYLMAVCGRL